MFRPTIRNLLLAAFAAVGALIAALGLYGVGTITESGRLVVETYDRPLMSISHARAALAEFLATEARLASPPHSVGDLTAWRRDLIDGLEHEVRADLGITRQRALSPEGIAVAAAVEQDFARWRAAQFATPRDEADIARASSAVTRRIDQLIETAAGDGFLFRERALEAIRLNRQLAIGAVVLAMAFAATITLLLGRRIVRPIKAAAAVASRIASGDLMAPVPPARDDETGQLLAAMQVMQDNLRATMEKEVAQRRWAQMSLVDAIERSPQAVFLLDAEDRILIANSQARTHFSSVAEAFDANTRFDAFLDRAHTAGIFATLPQSEREEVHLTSGHWLRMTRSPTRDGGAIIFLLDITALKEREEALYTAKERAEAANAAKTSFLTAMSHELRTPLNAVIGFSEMIGGEMLGPVGTPAYRGYAQDIQRSGEHLLGIINDILDLAKFDAGKMQLNLDTVRIAEIFDDCRKIMGDQCARRGLALAVVPPPPVLDVQADRVKLRQILLNLLSNAVKFTPDGGSVSLSCRVAPGAVEFLVADSGIGMRSEDIPTALSPFGQIDSRLARAYEGTGLGLPLTRALAELHGGSLGIDSAPGIGTTVTVRLPDAARVAPGADVAPARKAA
jgi:two-component system cell cycle sensor histidine kinase PleC